MNKIELLEREQMRMDLPGFIAGDTVNITSSSYAPISQPPPCGRAIPR